MRGTALEAEGTACAKALSRRPGCPSVLEGRGGRVEWTAVPARGQELVQGPFRRTFSNTAVGVANVAASGLANAPLRPCFIVRVWACVFFLRRNIWEARRAWTFGETPEVTARPAWVPPLTPTGLGTGLPGRAGPPPRQAR